MNLFLLFRSAPLKLPSRRQTRFALWGVGLLSTALLLTASACGRSSGAGQKTTRPIAARVDVAPVVRRNVERQLAVTGSLLPYAETTVSAEVSGRVTDLHFDVQQAVRQGDELTHFDDTEYRLQLAQAKAALAQARLAAERAAQDLLRNQELLTAGSISQWAYDVSKTASEAAKAQQDAAEAAVTLAEKRMRDTLVRAPISGFITARYVNIGDYLRAPAPVATIVNVNPLKVKIAVPERFAAAVKPGQPLSVSVDAYPNRTFTGHVTIINPATDPSTRTFTVEGVVPNPDGRLKPGFFAKVSITTGVAKQVLVIPAEAVVTVGGKPAVYVARNGMAKLTPVEVSERQDHMVEVTTGVAAGDTVLVSGHTMLTDGAPISIIK